MPGSKEATRWLKTGPVGEGPHEFKEPVNCVRREAAIQHCAKCFAIDPTVSRMRPPKVPLTEVEIYTYAQQEAMLAV